MQHGNFVEHDRRFGIKHPNHLRRKHSGLVFVLQKSVFQRTLSTAPDIFLNASPIYHAEQLVARGETCVPFLAIHGDRDAFVPPKESRYRVYVRVILSIRAHAATWADCYARCSAAMTQHTLRYQAAITQ